GYISADRINSNTITGDMIASETVTANNIAGNTITGSEIAGNTITGAEISGTAIDGMVITGATIRTDDSGQRVVMDSVDGLVGYDASETKVTQVGTDGQLAAVGATLKSVDSSERVEFTSSGFKGYSGAWNVRESFTRSGRMVSLSTENRNVDGPVWAVFQQWNRDTNVYNPAIAYFDPVNRENNNSWVFSDSDGI